MKRTGQQPHGLRKRLKRFNLVLGLVLMGCFLVNVWQTGTPQFWLMALSLLFILAAINCPALMWPFYAIWRFMTAMTAYAVLAVIFSGWVLPVRLLARAMAPPPAPRRAAVRSRSS